MSRQLPSHPNLEHLRKQAKELLHRVQALHPDWQLADAQHAVARDYGFASWPVLKAHVESVEPDPRPIATRPEPHTKRAAADRRARCPDVGLPTSSSRSVTRRISFEAEGEPHRSDEAGNGHMLVARWLDSRSLQVLDTMGGEVVGTGAYVVSEDARALTVTAGGQLLVFDRG